MSQTQDDIMRSALEDKIDVDTVKVSEPIIIKKNLYALGGCGIKLVSKLPDADKHFRITTIDTSSSEDALLHGLDVTRIYLTDNRDGSGAVKEAKYEVLKDGIEASLESTTPDEVNYVLFSASGASGSTASFILTDELLKLGRSVVLICSMNSSNELRTRNGFKTLVSLHNLATQHNVNIPIYFGQNLDLEVQDKHTAAFIMASNAMLNGGVIGVDDSDRRNFLSPCNIKDLGIGPSLLSLSLSIENFDNKNQAETNYASSLVLTEDAGKEGRGATSKVTFSGLLDAHLKDYIAGLLKREPNFDLVTMNTDFIPPYQLISELKKTIANYDTANLTIKQEQGRIMNDISQGNNTGIVL